MILTASSVGGEFLHQVRESHYLSGLVWWSDVVQAHCGEEEAEPEDKANPHLWP